MIKRALLSVSDKTGLVEFAQGLTKLGIELISTGGTSTALKAAGLAVQDVSDLTGFPEIMDGRVKTLHPKVHGGLLSIRGNPKHEAARLQNAIENIDLLVVNLYPFEETLARDASREEIIENIDVGGPAMIRAAAKNHDSVTVIVDPRDYDKVLNELRENQSSTHLKTRQQLAAKAFSRTASYDAAISFWFNTDLANPTPDFFALGGLKQQSLRYGENPHQSAALYRLAGGESGVGSAQQIQGKELSYNNINDTDAALAAVREFSDTAPACVIVKHANPCGVATGLTLLEAYQRAFACDQTSAFGGIIALNQKLDGETAEEISKIFTEVILVPEADKAARAILSAKKNLRLLILPELSKASRQGVSVKTIAGGFLVQTADKANVEDMTLKVVTKRQPTEQEMLDLRFAFRVAKHVKSNAIVFAKNGATVGIGAGQMSRIDSTRIAVRKGEDAQNVLGLEASLIRGSVLASDAFFPFADGVEAAAAAGATAVIQPGGALKDAEVIAAADKAGLAMIFTGYRHFRH